MYLSGHSLITPIDQSRRVNLRVAQVLRERSSRAIASRSAKTARVIAQRSWPQSDLAQPAGQPAALLLALQPPTLAPGPRLFSVFHSARAVFQLLHCAASCSVSCAGSFSSTAGSC